MRTQASLNCANYFWKVFEQLLAERENFAHPVDENERLRLLSSVAFTAIDAQMSAFWSSHIVPDWQEFSSLLQLLANDSEELEKLTSLSSPHLQRHQLLAGMCFIGEIENPDKFSPNFIDAGMTLLILDSEGSSEHFHQAAAIILFKLQKLRNKLLSTGQAVNAVDGNQALLLINFWVEVSRHLNPIFHFSLRDQEQTKTQAA